MRQGEGGDGSPGGRVAGSGLFAPLVIGAWAELRDLLGWDADERATAVDRVGCGDEESGLAQRRDGARDKALRQSGARGNHADRRAGVRGLDRLALLMVIRVGIFALAARFGAPLPETTGAILLSFGINRLASALVVRRHLARQELATGFGMADGERAKGRGMVSQVWW